MDVAGMKNIRRYRLQSELNILPLIGILLVSITSIFSFYKPTFVCVKPISLRLPVAENTSDFPPDWNMVKVRQKWDGSVFVNEIAVKDISKTGQIVLKELKRMKPRNEKILLEIDRDTKYGQVVDLMAQIKKVELYDIALLAYKVSE